MSGSDAKRRRKEQRAEGLDKQKIREEEELARKKKTRRKIWIAAPIVAVVLVFIILMNSSLPYKLTAVEAGNTRFTAADFNYYYQMIYGNFQNSYGSVLGDALGDSASLEEEMFSDDQTFAEYFTDTAITTMTETAALCEAAEAEGFALTQDELDEINSQVASMSAYAPYYGFKNADQYFAAIYGKGVTEEVVRRNVQRVVLSDNFGTYKQESKTFPEDEILAQYEDNRDNYDKVIYRYYYISSGTTPDTEEEAREAGMAEAKAVAEEFAAYATSEEKFMERALELASTDPEKTEDEIKPYRYSSGTMRRYMISSLASSYADWLTATGRSYGDVEAVESSNGYAVLFYVGRDDSQYKTRTIRHILINVAEDGEDDEPGTALAAAYEKAETYLQDWKDNGGDEAAFSKTAQTYSADTETYEEGGLIENACWGGLATDVDEWIFDEARSSGDVETIEAEDGLHIIYYVGETDEAYWHYAALANLQSDFYKAWKEDLVATYTAQQKLGMKFVRK